MQIIYTSGNVYDICPAYLPYIHWICQKENDRKKETVIQGFQKRSLL